MTRAGDRDGERGSVMVMAIGALSLMLVLGAASVLVSRQASGSAGRDRSAKRALAAAEAGLGQAAYRLTFLRTAPTMCLGATGPTYAAAPSGGECTAVSGELTPDVRFEYHATPALGAAACALAPATGTQDGQTDHCITSTGEVAGVRRRLQARVRVDRAGPYPYPGLLGLEGMDFKNGVGVTGSTAGSNGLIKAWSSMSPRPSALQLGPAAPAPQGLSGTPSTYLPQPWTLPSRDDEFEAAETGPNANAGLGVGYDAGSRRYAISTSRTLPAGTYSVCDLYVKERGFSLAAGAKVRIYVDSPDRPGSSCQPGPQVGRFCLDSSVDDPGINGAGDPANLEIFVYGAPANRCSDGAPGRPWQTGPAEGVSGASDVVFGNSVTFAGTLHAPRSDVRAINSVTPIRGAIAARRITLGNSISFSFAAGLSGGTPAYTGVRRLSWVECRSTRAVAGDPESGCA